MAKKLTVMMASALMLSTSAVLAGIIFVPVGGRYISPESASVNVTGVPTDAEFRIRTRDLEGVLTLDCSGVEDVCEEQGFGNAGVPFLEQLDLVVDRIAGTVEGRVRGELGVGGWSYSGNVRGAATCIRSGFRRCSQLIVKYNHDGVMFDQDVPVRIGSQEMRVVGSLLFTDAGPRWAVLSSSGGLGLMGR